MYLKNNNVVISRNRYLVLILMFTFCV